MSLNVSWCFIEGNLLINHVLFHTLPLRHWQQQFSIIMETRAEQRIWAMSAQPNAQLTNLAVAQHVPVLPILPHYQSLP